MRKLFSISGIFFLILIYVLIKSYHPDSNIEKLKNVSSVETVISEIKKIAEMASVVYMTDAACEIINYSNDYLVEIGDFKFGESVKENRLDKVFYFKVKAGIETDSLQISVNPLRVVLPQTKILSVELYKTTVNSEKGDFAENESDSLLFEAKEKAVLKAIEMGILEQANDDIRVGLASMFENMNIKSYEIR